MTRAQPPLQPLKVVYQRLVTLTISPLKVAHQRLLEIDSEVKQYSYNTTVHLQWTCNLASFFAAFCAVRTLKHLSMVMKFNLHNFTSKWKMLVHRTPF